MSSSDFHTLHTINCIWLGKSRDLVTSWFFFFFRSDKSTKKICNIIIWFFLIEQINGPLMTFWNACCGVNSRNQCSNIHSPWNIVFLSFRPSGFFFLLLLLKCWILNIYLTFCMPFINSRHWCDFNEINPLGANVVIERIKELKCSVQFPQRSSCSVFFHFLFSVWQLRRRFLYYSLCDWANQDVTNETVLKMSWIDLHVT